MISFQLDTKQQEIIEKYRDFTKRWIIPNRMKYDELATFPWDIVKAAYDEKIINASMPVEYGGHGHSIFEGAIASEELGY
nr:acyl-CoA dehydrogenase family protein [Bacteroidales bacterium]